MRNNIHRQYPGRKSLFGSLPRFVALGCLILGSGSVCGEVVEGAIKSQVLGRSWNYHAFLPDDFSSNTDKKYPVIVLLHGSGGDQAGWDVAFPCLDSMIRQGLIGPAIAIAPASGTSWWVDGVEQFETAFFSDLVPEIRQKYRARDDREAWIIAGYSMGGYGALRYALSNSRMFAGAILLSPALYSGEPPEESSARSSGAFGTPFDPARWTTLNYPEILQHYLDRQLPVNLFIAAGDDEWNHAQGWEFNMEVQAVRLYETLHKKHGTPAELRILDGVHDWSLWLPLFREGLSAVTRDLAPFRSAGRNPMAEESLPIHSSDTRCTTR